MDHVSPPNIHIISTSDLNTRFNDKSHSDWSKANQIAFVTLDGIYIIKPQLDDPQGPFRLQLIRNPIVRFKHYQLSQIYPYFDSVWQTLDQAQYMQVYSDPALTKHVDKLSLVAYPRRFRVAKWSPPIDIYPKQCYLATITLDYQLLIYGYIKHSWVVICDLSMDYDKFWHKESSNLISINQETNDFNKTRRALHSLSFCYTCWLTPSDSSEKPFLLASTITGDIVIWQLNINNDPSEDQTVRFQLRFVIRTDKQYITSMQLLDYLLVLSTRDGQLILYDLTKTFAEFKKTRGKKSPEVQPIPATVSMWHNDQVEIQDFYIQPLNEGYFRIVLSKHTNICWTTMVREKNAEGLTTKLLLGDSYSAIDGLDKELSLQQTPATWLRPAGDRLAVLVADDGSFYLLEFNDENRQDVSPDYEAIRTGKVDLTRMVPRGLCTSPNGQLISMISTITLQYEPAKIPASTKLILIPTKNDWRSLLDTIDKLRSETWLQSQNIESPMDVCDMIDFVISYYCQLDSDRFNELYKLIRTEIGNPIITPLNNAQYVKLKILSFIILKMLNSRPSKLIDSDGIAMLELEIYDKLFHHHISNCLEDLAMAMQSDSGDTISPQLNQTQINSLCHYMSWLNRNPSRKSLRKSYEDLLEKFNIRNIQADEKCPICECEIPFEGLNQGYCNNGHGFQRCSRSLVIINPKCDNDLVCEHCSHHYLGDLVWSTRASWLCIYCQ